jgi:glycosyltransferase involved in cell wall biosynthesis
MIAKRVNILVSKYDYLKAPLFILSNYVRDEIGAFKTYGLTLNFSRLKTLLHYYVKAKKVEKLLMNDFNKYHNEDTEIFVYGHFLTDFTFAAAMLKSEMKSKIFARLHGADLYYERELNHYLPFRKFIFEQSEKFFFISEGGLKYFSKRLQLSKNDIEFKTKVNYLGVLNHTYRNVNSKSSIGKFTIVTNSWTVPLKRLELVIEAIQLLPQNIEITWTHFGDHGNVFYDYFSFLNKKWDQLKVSNKNVNIQLMGSVSRETIFMYYQQNHVDVFINCSSTEGIPITMMEAMSFAIPVIGTNVGGVPEIVSNNENGYLLPPNPSSEEIANLILKVYELKDEDYQNLSKQAYNTWFHKFNSEINELDFVKDILK